MNHHPVFAEPFCPAGAFEPVYHYIIAPGPLCGKAQAAQGIGHQIIITFNLPCRPYDAVVEISKVMVHRPAAGYAPRQFDAMSLQIGEIHLRVSALIKADDNRRRILPQAEHGVPAEPLQEELIVRHVPVGISAVIDEVSHCAITPLPSISSPSYHTANWPGEMPLWGWSKRM